MLAHKTTGTNAGHLAVKILVRIFTIVSVICVTALSSAAQEGLSPDRGFRPAGSYAISDIETISMHNGNVLLNVPVSSLPTGRGGLSAGVGLIYNTKLLDTWIYQFHDFYGNGEPGTWPLQMLQPSYLAGWKYSFGYQLQTVSRQDQYSWEDMPKCPYPEAVYNFKLKVVFPDGSEHFFRPIGYSESPYLNDGYFQITPDGWGYSCGSVPSGHPPVYTSFTANRMTYYSTDGSYLRLDIEHDGDQNYFNNPWTLSFPDGRRVTGGNAPQRMYDRNNNYVEIQNITYNNHPATRLVDQVDRSVILEYDTDANQDYIYAQGFNNEPLMYTVKWKNTFVNKLFTPTDDTTAPVGPQTLNISLRVVDQIILPTQTGGLAYTFNYNGNPSDPPPEGGGYSNGWGEVSSVTLPSGAQANYQYLQDGQNSVLSETVLENAPTRKDLTYLQEYDGSSTTATDTWTYSFNGLQGAGGTITGPDGSIYGETCNVGLGSSSPSAHERWDYGVSLTTFKPDGSKIERLWQPNTPYGAAHPANAYVKTEFTSIKDAAGNYAKTAIRDYNYDKNGNVTRIADYDWVDYAAVPRDSSARPTGVPANAPLKRISANTYYNATPDASDSFTDNPYVYHRATSPALRNAVSATEVSNGAQILSRTEFSYDDPSSAGNLIQQTSWDSTKGGYTSPVTTSNSISISNQYDSWSTGATGRLIQTTDPRGTVAQFTYGSVGGFDLYPTQVQMAFQTSVQRTEAREYDFSTGLVTRVTDADNNVSTSSAYDVFGRPTLVRAAEGKAEETRTATEYSDIARRIIVRSDLNSIGDGSLVSVQHFDQLGRVRLKRQLEDSSGQSATDEATGIKVQTRYLFSGSNSYVLTSNPYRANTSGGAGGESTMGWTRSKSDNGGRLIEVQTFGGVGLPAPWGGNGTSTGTVTNSYNANEVTVTDQAGKSRKSVTDALGKLVQVYEDPAGLNYLTSYNYDGLSNLITVNQGSQTRSFVYSSLGLVTSATNPESGSISYQYDNKGNLTQKTDARGIVTTYGYDPLSRVTTRTYNDGTPGVSYNYDSASYGKGRLASVGSSVSSYSYSAYDALGRALGGSQTIGSQSYPVGYTYDRAGHVLTQTYPSGRTVTNTYDSAGRANSVAGNLGDGSGRTYSTGISYAAGGQMMQEQFGTATPVYNKLFYNSRGQLAVIGVTSVNDGATWNRGRIGNRYSFQCNAFDPGCAGSDNNGNLVAQDLFVPQDDQASTATTMLQAYNYDGLNRMTGAWDPEGNNAPDCPSGNGCTGWSRGYQYDQYGNRTIDPAWTWGAGLHPQFAVDPNTNRLGVPSGQPGAMSYDGAGNLTFDSYTGEGARLYDGANRMTKAWADGQWQIYCYDGDGRRVKRIVNGNQTWQVYGIGGVLLAEYAANTDASNPQKEYGYRNGQLLVTAEPSANIHWLATDQLGTPRMIFDNTGSLSGTSRHDYLPFGEELFAGTNWRTPELGYSGDGTRQKFTQKERDNETGLDYFLARYYASTQGRFTSADPDNYQAKRDLTDPQSWNAYAYVNNNPLARNDPDGRGFWEKLKNFFNGYGWRSNEEVRQLDEKWRNWLREQERQAGGTLVYCPGGCAPGSKGYKVNINALSTYEVLGYSRSLKESIENHTVQHFSSDEIEKMTQIISLTVAPQHIQDALTTIKRTGNPPSGYKGGDVFQNDGRGGGQVLPKTDTGGNPITYREYDVQPYQQGVNRGAERIVRGSDGSTWYTTDHYKTFARID